MRLLAGLEEWDAAAPENVFFIPQDLELPPRRLLVEQLNSVKSAGIPSPANSSEPERSSTPASAPKADLLANFARTAGTDRLLEKQGLSGGERSRIALLWALASDSPTVLLDEPMAAIALDDRERILLAFLDTAHTLGKWVIMASHDPFSEAAQARFNVVELEHAKG